MKTSFFLTTAAVAALLFSLSSPALAANVTTPPTQKEHKVRAVKKHAPIDDQTGATDAVKKPRNKAAKATSAAKKPAAPKAKASAKKHKKAPQEKVVS